jgi:hypothetical protein
MGLNILMLIFGIVALLKGEIKITGGRKVTDSTARLLGFVLLVGALGSFIPDYGGLIQLVLFVTVVIIGLATSEKIDKAQEISWGGHTTTNENLGSADIPPGRADDTAALPFSQEQIEPQETKAHGSTGMAMLTRGDLVKLYFAIYEHFNGFEIRRFSRDLKFNFEDLSTGNYQDEVREFILVMYRRQQLNDLINICVKYKPDFDWENVPMSFEHGTETPLLHEDQIPIWLSNYFSVSELRQLCFFLNVDFEDVAGFLISDHQIDLIPRDKHVLEKLHVDVEGTPITQIQKLLKFEWANQFLFYCERSCYPISRISDVMVFMRPDIFNSAQVGENLLR